MHPLRAVLLPLPLLLAAWCAPARLAAEEALDTSPQGLQHYFDVHDYAHAEAACRQLMARNASDPNPSYNLACALAREGRSDDALAALKYAEGRGFSDADHALQDDDLASLRASPAFQAIVAAMRAHPAEAGAPCEPLQAVPGARVVDRTPSAGLRYRLYINELASAKDQARLMVWLHPSGGSADQIVLGRLAPDLIQHGWALMIFPQKQYMGWTGDEFPRLEPCIEDALRLPEIDPHRPVPLTFSAGGQLALEVWHQVPQYWSALVLDAAYPIDQATMQPRPLTPGEIACKTPVLAIVGGKDGGCALWEKDAPVWNQAGVPTEVVRVEGHGHEFLYVQGVWTRTLAWLDALKAFQKGKPSPGTTRDGKDATRLGAKPNDSAPGHTDPPIVP
jgi:hypothetical protein